MQPHLKKKGRQERARRCPAGSTSSKNESGNRAQHCLLPITPGYHTYAIVGFGDENLSKKLSRDVWRYLWDAHVVTHGYSPYVYAPGDKVLLPLRTILYVNSRFRNIPTDYPPGAELIFILGYLLDAHSLLGIKSVFLGCDMISCGALTWLLTRKRLDPRRVVIYAWCPLPIIEFARQSPHGSSRELVSVLHRNSEYLRKRSALASLHDTSGDTDKIPVLTQSCRMSNVRIVRFLAPTRSACRVY
jgi:hypothetical protein